MHTISLLPLTHGKISHISRDIDVPAAKHFLPAHESSQRVIKRNTIFFKRACDLLLDRLVPLRTCHPYMMEQ